MLLEIMMVVPMIAVAVHGAWSKCQEIKAEEKLVQKALTSPPAPSRSPAVELVIEMLRQDEGWITDTVYDSKYSGKKYKHEKTGVSIDNSKHRASGFKHTNMSVDGSTVSLTDIDKDAIRAELEAFDTRAADYKQREIARVLAERILGGKNAALLGDDRAAAAEDDNMAGNDTVSPGLLTFDPHSGQVVQIGSTDTGVRLDDRLRERYGLPLKIHHNMADSLVYQDEALRYY
jgi:hypothetical protein